MNLYEKLKQELDWIPYGLIFCLIVIAVVMTVSVIVCAVYFVVMVPFVVMWRYFPFYFVVAVPVVIAFYFIFLKKHERD